MGPFEVLAGGNEGIGAIVLQDCIVWAFLEAFSAEPESLVKIFDCDGRTRPKLGGPVGVRFFGAPGFASIDDLAEVDSPIGFENAGFG